MSGASHPDFPCRLKQLISNITKLEDGNKQFKMLEKQAAIQIKNSGSMSFSSYKQVEELIQGLADKFVFHGYRSEAQDLRRLFGKLFEGASNKTDTDNRLNVVRFLMFISESPTNNFHKYPKCYASGDTEQVVDWVSYLKEGIPRWSPPPLESSDEDSDSSFCTQTECDEKADYRIVLTNKDKSDSGQIVNCSESPVFVYPQINSEIQSQWFNEDYVFEHPQCLDSSANVASLWDDFVTRYTGGLVQQKSSIVSEYKIMRETLWQFHGVHSSFFYHFVGKQLLPKPGVTIASIRAPALEYFMTEFAACAQDLQYLKDFQKSIETTRNGNVAPDTYKNYCHAQKMIIEPVLEGLVKLENIIKLQESPMTLIELLRILRPSFRIVNSLKLINEEVVIDFQENSPLKCAVTLLSRLYKTLLRSSSKTEQDLYLTLYLASLNKYFTVIQSWLCTGTLEDYTGEFIIENNDSGDQTDFRVKEPECVNGEIFTLIKTRILQIGKNTHLLKLLKKLYMRNAFLHNESLHDEFVNKLLERANKYSTKQAETVETDEPQVEGRESPISCDGKGEEFLKRLFELGKETRKIQPKPNLYKRIKSSGNKLFPAQRIIPDVFVSVLNEKYDDSGLLVKTILIRDYLLEKQLSLIKHAYLFHDDLIFRFYTSLFQQLDEQGRWGNITRFTSQLQDILMDPYPDLCDNVSVEVSGSWKSCRDMLRACDMIRVNYQLEWPVSIVVNYEQLEKYKEIFGFVLKIKWALYTLNRLYFGDVTDRRSEGRKEVGEKSYRKFVRRLLTLRFGMVNLLSSVQHYVLGHAYSVRTSIFEKDMETAADLESLCEAHSKYVDGLFESLMGLRDFESKGHGIVLLLFLVRKLKEMWSNPTDYGAVDRLHRSFTSCRNNIDTIINPK